MKFHCPECKTKYRISEEKIDSRPTAKLRCKQCSHLFSVMAAIEEERLRPTPSLAPPALPKASEDAPPRRSLPPLRPPSRPPAAGLSLVGRGQAATAMPRVGALPSSPPRVGAGYSARSSAALAAAMPLPEPTEPSVVVEPPEEAETRPLPARALDELETEPLPAVSADRSLSAPTVATPARSSLVDGPALAPALPALSPSLPPLTSFVPPKPPKTVPALFAYASTTVALFFGLGLGYVLFGNTPSEVRYVTAPAEIQKSELSHAPPPPPAAAEAAGDPVMPNHPSPAGANSRVAKGLGASTEPSVKQPAGNAKPSGSESPTGTEGSLLAGLGAAGPGAPVAASGTGDGAGSSLDASAIERTVRRYQSTVKRVCWQRALNGASLGASSTARVNVTIQVAPNGSVRSATTSGDPAGYPGLAGCIQSNVASWKFPTASGSTTTRVPFVFAAQ